MALKTSSEMAYRSSLFVVGRPHNRRSAASAHKVQDPSRGALWGAFENALHVMAERLVMASKPEREPGFCKPAVDNHSNP